MAKAKTPVDDGFPPNTKPELKKLITKLNASHKDARVLGIASQIAHRAIPLSTGSYMLDWATGVGGLLPRKISEWYGLPGAGKSRTIYEVIKACQATGQWVMYGDAEDSMGEQQTQDWMRHCGVDVDNLIYVRDTAESMMNVVHDVASDPRVGLIVVDSLGGMALEKLVSDGEVGDHNMRTIAGLMQQFTGKFVSVTKGAHLACINQVRADFKNRKPGQEKVKTSGGYNWHHMCQLRVELSGWQLFDEIEVYPGGPREKQIVGLETSFKIIKNKWASAGKTGVMRYYWDTGLDKVDELVALAEKHGCLMRSGGWTAFVGENGKELKINGLANFVHALRDHQDLQADLWKMIVERRTNTIEINPEELDVE